jgi:hypothetical protein
MATPDCYREAYTNAATGAMKAPAFTELSFN